MSMTTQQKVLYPFLILFMILMLIAIGAWFKSGLELQQKSNALQAQKDITDALKREIEGSDSNNHHGLEWRVKDQQEGLEVRATKINAEVPLLKSNPGDPANLGVDELEAKYNSLSPEVKQQWTEAAVAALNQYKKDRTQFEGDIVAALKRLADQRKEKEEKEAAKQKELETEEANRETELKKINQEYAKMTQDLEAVRYEHEATQQKVTEVSRDLSKVKTVVSQGKITRADALSKTAFIDLGTRQGVRKGMIFEIYSGAVRQHVRKGKLQVTDVDAFSSKGILLSSAQENRWDSVTGWVPDSPNKLYSPFAADGPEENNAIEVGERKTLKDRVEALRIEKIAKEQGAEAAEAARAEKSGNATPPAGLSLSLTPVEAGDGIFNADFIPLVSTNEYHAQIREELKTLRDVNLGPLTFYIADTVRTYRKEYIKRLCEHNGCKVSDTMNPNVNIVIVGSGFTDPDAVEEQAAKKRGKDNLKEDDKNMIATADTLVAAKKYGAGIRSEDEMEALFDLRARKQELLNGSAIQPGRSSFFIAGKTKYRSPELLAQYIVTNGGIIAPSIESKVDYVVVGESPDDVFIEKVKKLGLKIVREDELPELLGVK